MDFVIWDSYLDLSKEGIALFSEKYAADFGKTPEQLRSMPLLDLASIYMWNKRAENLREAKRILDYEIGVPIVLLRDNVDIIGRHSIDCTLLDSENLKDIFQCREGLTTKFYTDGQNLRCDDLTNDGMNHYIFRAVRDLKKLGEYARACKTHKELPSREEMDVFSASLSPEIDRIYGRYQTRYQPKSASKKNTDLMLEVQR